MEIKIIKPQEFVKKEWSGGTTTQLYIYPDDAQLENRNFDFRISSATFIDTKSHFSDFSGYQRYLLPLQGEIFVSHEGKYSRTLVPYETDFFMGDWSTSSENTLDTRDLNLIVKKGLPCNLFVLNPGENYTPKKSGKLFVFSTDETTIDVFGAQDVSIALVAGSLAMIDESETISKIQVKSPTNDDAKIVICEVNK